MIDFRRDYTCECGHSEYGVDPNEMKGHWMSPVCPSCGGNMKLLPSNFGRFNKKHGNLDKRKRYNNPDGEVAAAFKKIGLGGRRNA